MSTVGPSLRSGFWVASNLISRPVTWYAVVTPVWVTSIETRSTSGRGIRIHSILAVLAVLVASTGAFSAQAVRAKVLLYSRLAIGKTQGR